MNKSNTSLIIIVVLLILFSVLTGLVFSGTTLAIDSVVYEWVFQFNSPILTEINKLASFIGSTPVIVAVCAVLLLLSATRKKIGIPIAMTAGVSGILNETIKHLLVRPRPDINQIVAVTGYSFPSGHSMNNMAIYTMLALLIVLYIKDKRTKILLIAICYIVALAIGFSRIYLGVHYATDVIGGFLLGVTVAMTIFTIIQKEKSHL